MNVIHRTLTSEIKVCIILFQNTPQGMYLYFSLVGHPQTINESNYFFTTFLKACDIAATQSGNSVLFNVSTYGVAYEFKGNLILIIQ